MDRACPWCSEPGAWPDRCAADLDPFCADTIAERCVVGDHRRCWGWDCPVAATWHLSVRRAGVLAAEAAGTTWAVVSIIGDCVRVVGTTDHLGRAKSLLRTGTAKRAGITGPAAKGAVYVVRASDAAFF